MITQNPEKGVILGKRLELQRIGFWRSVKSRGILKLSGCVSFIYLVFNAITVRPNADDYSALGRSASSCGEWLDFASKNGENSVGFLIFARATFCTGAQESLANFQIMNLSRLMFGLICIFAILYQVLENVSTLITIPISLILYGLIICSVSNPEVPIRQYLGGLWAMQWVQHSASFMVVVVLLTQLNNSKKNIAFLRLQIISFLYFFCAAYSILTLAYVLPILLYFFYTNILNRSLSTKKKLSLVFWTVITFIFVFNNLSGSFRAQRANQEQAEDSIIRRFLGLLILSIRENFVINLFLIVTVFGIGLLTNKFFGNDLKKTVLLFTLHIFWVTIVLFFAEFFTYFAIWHHTPLRFSLSILFFFLGVKVGHRHKSSNYQIRNAIVVLFMSLTALMYAVSTHQMLAYSNSWDQHFLKSELLSKEQILIMPLGLGDRSHDPYWGIYEEAIIGSEPIPTPFIGSNSVVPQYAINVLRAPEKLLDCVIKKMVGGISGSDRLKSWLV
jgi:hypothetical protein